MLARLVLSVTLLLLAACTEVAPVAEAASDQGPSGTRTQGAPTGTPSGLQPSEGFAVSEVVFTDGDRSVTMPVLVADDRALRSTGLMHRTDLPDDAGMLFVFDAPTGGGFWMKNTVLPLSIAFVGQDGTVHEVMDMEPCTADPCPTYTPDEAYLYAVEANQGYFAEHGITPGWSLEVDPGGGGGR